MGLGERIRTNRERMGWTQGDLAEKAGVSRQSVGGWEAGRVVPSTDTLIVLAGLFGCPVDSLLSDRPAIQRKEVVGYLAIPALRATALGAGASGLEAALIEAEMTTTPIHDRIGEIVQGKEPFLLTVDRAGMGVEVGADLFVNPGESVRTGDAALCCVGGTWMVRGIVWRRDNSVELRSRDGSITATRDEIESGWALIAGRIQFVIAPPPAMV